MKEGLIDYLRLLLLSAKQCSKRNWFVWEDQVA